MAAPAQNGGFFERRHVEGFLSYAAALWIVGVLLLSVWRIGGWVLLLWKVSMVDDFHAGLSDLLMPGIVLLVVLVVFQVLICVGWTPYSLASWASVFSSRRAARTTCALNWAE